MKVRNKETGEVEMLRHGPATDAVTAGTHEFVSDDEDQVEKVADASATSIDKMSKDELISEAAKRGVLVKPSDTKAEIVAALSA